MADTCEVSSSSSSMLTGKDKPVVVRVKRKAFQARLDVFWLEINGRPLKKPLLDLGNLSITDSATGKEESKTKKLLVHHVDTINSSEAMKDIFQSFLPNPTGSKNYNRKIEERKHLLKQEKKQDQLRTVARQKHEDLVRRARFEQIWKSRRAKGERNDDSLHEICHIYDVVRIDGDQELPEKMEEPEDAPVEDIAILCNYLPLIREFLPTAAEDIESDMNSYASKQDGYVYDIYTVEDDMSINGEDASTEYPLVQVYDDDDYYDDPWQSEYESDDSNAENNPLNDYPEEPSEDEERESGDPFDDLEGSFSECEEDIVDTSEEAEDRRWVHR